MGCQIELLNFCALIRSPQTKAMWLGSITDATAVETES